MGQVIVQGPSSQDATGNSTVLMNELNATLANWEKYAAEWNAVKKNKANRYNPDSPGVSHGQGVFAFQYSLLTHHLDCHYQIVSVRPWYVEIELSGDSSIKQRKSSGSQSSKGISSARMFSSLHRNFPRQ